MKSSFALAGIVSLILSAAALAAADAPTAGQPQPGSPPANSSSAAAAAAAVARGPVASRQARPAPPPPDPYADIRSNVTLRRNVTLRLAGTINGNLTMERGWTGAGPNFETRGNLTVSTLTDPLNPAIGYARINLKEVSEGYQIIVDLAVEEWAPSEEGGGATGFRPKQTRTAVKAVLKPGATQKITTDDGVANLTATLTETPDSVVLPSGIPPSRGTKLDRNLLVLVRSANTGFEPVEVSAITAGEALSMRGVPIGSFELNGAAQSVPEDFGVVVTSAGDGAYRVEYQASIKVAMRTSVTASQLPRGAIPQRGLTSTIAYTSYTNSGAALFKPGQTMVVCDGGWQRVEITLRLAD